MRTAIAAVVVFTLAWLTKPVRGEELTATQELIKAEILRLGGDWEPRLVGFIGPRFTAHHFEMLEHMTGIENVEMLNVSVPPTAYASIAKMRTVRWLEVQEQFV